MRHLTLKHVTDPATGKVYPIPAGGAADVDDSQPDADDGADTADDGQKRTRTGPPPDDTDGADDGDDADDGDGDDTTLGPKGEKALREMKKRARAAERELRKLKAQKPDDKADDDTPDPDQIRQEVEAEVVQKVAKERALDKLEAKAARTFQNPELARKLLADQSDDFLDEKGNPDVEAIQEALDELLEDEPYLAVDDGRKFKGTADSGTRNGSDKPAQLTQDDVKRLSREGKHDEIEKARQEGRLNDLLGVSSS